MSRPPAPSLLQPLCPECAALTPLQRRMDRSGPVLLAHSNAHIQMLKQRKKEARMQLNSAKHTRRGRGMLT